ncbi:MAG: putative dsRNA-binding protein, partial [Chloroflexota bacterium]|nr:putative dsRNA-binding protein [Chloroflexota bacterium]
IYLDQGLSEARKFIIEHLKPLLERIQDGEVTLNYKTRLQELVQSEKHSAPTYHLVEAIGPDHERQFTIEALIDSKVAGIGTGRNKKAAEMQAAKSAWDNLQGRDVAPVPSA